jgi:hypothetical protein
LGSEVQAEPEVEIKVKLESMEVEETTPWGFGRGKGKGRGRGRGKMGLPPKQEKFSTKSSHISERIEILENNLKSPNINSERERILRWRIEKLREKLSGVQEKQIPLASPSNETPPVEQSPGASENTHQEIGWKGKVRGGRGRGAGCHGRGAGRHERGPKLVNVTIESTPIDRDAAGEALAEFHRAKVNLKVARKSGNSEAIATSEAAFRQAQQKKGEFGRFVSSPESFQA